MQAIINECYAFFRIFLNNFEWNYSKKLREPTHKRGMICYILYSSLLLSPFISQKLYNIMILMSYLWVKLFKEALSLNHNLFSYLGTRQSALWRVVASSSKRDAMSFPCGTETKVYMIFSPAWRFFFEVGRSPSLCWGDTRLFTFIRFPAKLSSSLGYEV